MLSLNLYCNSPSLIQGCGGTHNRVAKTFLEKTVHFSKKPSNRTFFKEKLYTTVHFSNKNRTNPYGVNVHILEKIFFTYVNKYLPELNFLNRCNFNFFAKLFSSKYFSGGTFFLRQTFNE